MQPFEPAKALVDLPRFPDASLKIIAFHRQIVGVARLSGFLQGAIFPIGIDAAVIHIISQQVCAPAQIAKSLSLAIHRPRTVSYTHLDVYKRQELDEEAVNLSGGEQQRLLLARALYKNAPVLVLDEPTAALDPISENAVYQKYLELTRGCTSVFISHRLASTRFCDRILFLEEGKIVEEMCIRDSL